MRRVGVWLGSLVCSPLVFLAFYSEYHWFQVDHRNLAGLLYVGAALIPLLFLRQKKQVLIFALLSGVVSSVLSEWLLPHEPTFFYPLDAYKSVLIILTTGCFALAQMYILLVVSNVRRFVMNRLARHNGKGADR
jgi:uncharacterized membrane protein